MEKLIGERMLLRQQKYRDTKCLIVVAHWIQLFLSLCIRDSPLNFKGFYFDSIAALIFFMLHYFAILLFELSCPYSFSKILSSIAEYIPLYSP